MEIHTRLYHIKDEIDALIRKGTLIDTPVVIKTTKGDTPLQMYTSSAYGDTDTIVLLIGENLIGN